MKPPVEAPTSKSVRPVTSTPNSIKGRGKLLAAPAHERGGSVDQDDIGVGVDHRAGLIDPDPVDEHRARQDHCAGLMAGFHQPPIDHDEIDALLTPCGRRSHAGPRLCA